MMNWFKSLFKKKQNKLKIIAVKKNGRGKIKSVKFDDETVVDIKEAIKMADENLIEGVEVHKIRNGHKILRSTPDEKTENNLSQLPTF